VWCEDRFHPVGGFVLKSWEHVAVRVHRQADLTMAERLHDHARMDALDE
jgi:hypothetical protein